MDFLEIEKELNAKNLLEYNKITKGLGHLNIDKKQILDIAEIVLLNQKESRLKFLFLLKNIYKQKLAELEPINNEYINFYKNYYRQLKDYTPFIVYKKLLDKPNINIDTELQKITSYQKLKQNDPQNYFKLLDNFAVYQYGKQNERFKQLLNFIIELDNYYNKQKDFNFISAKQFKNIFDTKKDYYSYYMFLIDTEKLESYYIYFYNNINPTNKIDFFSFNLQTYTEQFYKLLDTLFSDSSQQNKTKITAKPPKTNFNIAMNNLISNKKYISTSKITKEQDDAYSGLNKNIKKSKKNGYNEICFLDSFLEDKNKIEEAQKVGFNKDDAIKSITSPIPTKTDEVYQKDLKLADPNFKKTEIIEGNEIIEIYEYKTNNFNYAIRKNDLQRMYDLKIFETKNNELKIFETNLQNEILTQIILNHPISSDYTIKMTFTNFLKILYGEESYTNYYTDFYKQKFFSYTEALSLLKESYRGEKYKNNKPLEASPPYTFFQTCKPYKDENYILFSFNIEAIKLAKYIAETGQYKEIKTNKNEIFIYNEATDIKNILRTYLLSIYRRNINNRKFFGHYINTDNENYDLLENLTFNSLFNEIYKVKEKSKNIKRLIDTIKKSLQDLKNDKIIYDFDETPFIEYYNDKAVKTKLNTLKSKYLIIKYYKQPQKTTKLLPKKKK